MDLAQRPEGSVDRCPYTWKTIVISAAIGQFAIETYINWRQLRVLRRWSAPSEIASCTWNVKRTRFRIFNSFCSMVQVAALIGLDAIPALWRFVVEKEKKLLERTNLSRLFVSHDFDRSAIFIIGCYIGFLLINLPTYIYRILVLKERVIRDFCSRRNYNWVVRDIAKGRPVSAVMFFTGICALEFKIFRLKFDGNYVIGVGLSQLLFVILYPILTRPKRKSLSLMEPGRTKDAIEEVAVAAKFPLRNTYIIDGQDMHDIQVFGLPRRKYIAIPQTMMAESTIDDIVGLTAHAMGSWKYSNDFRIFCVGQLHFNLTWTYLVLFASEWTNYTAFGFKNEYPRMAAIIIFIIGFAPLMALILGLNINYMERKNDFIADKYAAELGHSAELTQALAKAQVADGSGDVDILFSLFYNPKPAMSERLAALQKLREETDPKDEGLISLSEEEKK